MVKHVFLRVAWHDSAWEGSSKRDGRMTLRVASLVAPCRKDAHVGRPFIAGSTTFHQDRNCGGLQNIFARPPAEDSARRWPPTDCHRKEERP